MFAQKLHRTFIAMFKGWVAFLSILPVLVLIVNWMDNRSRESVMSVWIMFAVFSVPVILVAWLLILLPTDLLIPESSRLRTPWIAAMLGALFGMLPFFLLGTYDQMTSLDSWWAEVCRSAADPDVWVYMSGAAIVGGIAALNITLHKKREITPASKPLPKKPFG